MEQKYIKNNMYDNGINFILIVVFKFFFNIFEHSYC